MGLDMYLSATIDGHEDEAGYWRKASAIHGWFVREVQGGEDDCEEYIVTIDKLLELQKLCEEIVDKALLKHGKVVNGQTLKDGEWVNMYCDGLVVVNAEEIRSILPPVDGFFFGLNQIDGWFVEEMQHTIKVIDKCKEWCEEENEDIQFKYRASW